MHQDQVLSVYQTAVQAVELQIATPEQHLIVALWKDNQKLEAKTKQQAQEISLLENHKPEVENEASAYLARFTNNRITH